MSSFDEIPHGPPPPAGEVGIGAVSLPDRQVGVMIANPTLLVHEGQQVAMSVPMSIAEAIQYVQAVRQAINDARRGRVRGPGGA